MRSTLAGLELEEPIQTTVGVTIVFAYRNPWVFHVDDPCVLADVLGKHES